MIDRNYILGGVAIAMGSLVAGYGFGRASKTIPDPDIKPFKESMRDRYKQVSELKLKADQKEEAFERVRDSIKRDIRSMFDKDHQVTLLDYSDKLWTEFYNKGDDK